MNIIDDQTKSKRLQFVSESDDSVAPYVGGMKKLTGTIMRTNMGKRVDHCARTVAGPGIGDFGTIGNDLIEPLFKLSNIWCENEPSELKMTEDEKHKSRKTCEIKSNFIDAKKVEKAAPLGNFVQPPRVDGPCWFYDDKGICTVFTRGYKENKELTNDSDS